MKIEFDTDEILAQLRDEIEDLMDGIVRRKVQEIVSGEVMYVLNKELDHIEKTPYNIIHHRIYAMLDKYIEQEVKDRIFEQECNGRRGKGE